MNNFVNEPTNKIFQPKGCNAIIAFKLLKEND
jgi:hypothetical protein